jgi:selenoprotein W-related protein
LADELKQSLGVDSKLIAGSGGVFEVTADGSPVFSKKEAGRFPEPGEVAGILKQRKS